MACPTTLPQPARQYTGRATRLRVPSDASLAPGPLYRSVLPHGRTQNARREGRALRSTVSADSWCRVGGYHDPCPARHLALPARPHGRLLGGLPDYVRDEEVEPRGIGMVNEHVLLDRRCERKSIPPGAPQPKTKPVPSNRTAVPCPPLHARHPTPAPQPSATREPE